VARSLGKGVVEFKKGLSDVTSGLDDASLSDYSSPYKAPSRQYDSTSRQYDSTKESTYADETPKFEVPGAVSTTAATGTVEYQPPASS
jgi:sec-independent protein translocase protein TatA